MIGAAETLRESVRLVRAHPVIAVSLGAAIVLSLCSVCTGFGAIVGPWFVCELYGIQITTATGISKARGVPWLLAAGVVLGTVLVIASTGWLSALGFGPPVPTADAALEPLPWPDTMRRVGLVAGSSVLAVGFIAPFLYAPLVLIDRGGRMGGAIVESAWLVAQGGVVRHLAIAFVVYAFQLSPALLSAMVIARTYERAATPIGLLVALPFLSFTIPLGQGILTASYLGMRDRLATPRAVIARGLPPRGLAVLLATVVLVPIASLLMLGLSALRASTPAPGPAPEGEVVLDRTVEGPLDVAIRDTTLALHVHGAAVTIVAGGEDVDAALPASWRGPIERVRVVRVRSEYVFEIHADGRVVHARVDGAGVRMDDDIRTRLEVWVPTWALYAILLAFGACGVLLVRALAPLGALRAAVDLTSEERQLRRAAAHRSSLRAGLALLPFALAALAGGLVSIGWL